MAGLPRFGSVLFRPVVLAAGRGFAWDGSSGFILFGLGGEMASFGNLFHFDSLAAIVSLCSARKCGSAGSSYSLDGCRSRRRAARLQSSRPGAGETQG